MASERSGPHPQQDELKRFMRGELSRAEMAGVVRHLLTGCPQCLEVTRGLWERRAIALRLMTRRQASQGRLATSCRRRLLDSDG